VDLVKEHTWNNTKAVKKKTANIQKFLEIFMRNQ